MLCFHVIEMEIVNFSNIIHGVCTLISEIQTVHYLGYLWMDMPCFLLNEQIEFHCSLLNLVMNEVVTHVYVIRLLR